jgi:hypothetical protein
VIILAFLIWFPVYLVLVRPVVERWLLQYADFIPVELHVIPALALPILAAYVYEKAMIWRRRDHT